MKRLFFYLSIAMVCDPTIAQTVNAAQQVVLEGIRASGGQGSFRASNYASDGSLYLLYDQGDGIRVLKSNSGGTNILAQAFAGSTGDSGVAMALDTNGNIYVTGTTTSNTLSSFGGVPFPIRADTSTNSFLAKYDENLNLVFLTFLGSGRTAASGVTATADSVFVTGVTFNLNFPVTAAAIQQSPALNSSENGFVERFTASGSTLVYATYLTGAYGNTIPTAIVADTADNTYITGSTSASGFPTINALQSAILGTTSGFLCELTPAGDGFAYSTFLAGAGITSIALDTSSDSLLLTGNISLGQFPVATVAMPLTSTSYQTLLRIPSDGQSVASSVLLVPGKQSYVSVGANGSAWIAGSLTTPLFSGDAPPDYSAGDSFLLHLTSDNIIDQTIRFGGTPTANSNYASLTSAVTTPSVNGSSVILAGTLMTTVSASLLSTQRFDLPQIQTPNTGLLPNAIHDVLPPSASCNSQCSGTAALLASLSSESSGPSLALSADGMPNLILRNMGSAAATDVAISASGFSVASNCGTTLAPSSQCGLALAGSGPGSLVVSSSNATTVTAALGTSSLQPDGLALSTAELDFGITTAASPTTQTVTVTNLSANLQTFTSVLDGGPSITATFTESSNDCPSGSSPGIHILAAGGSCHIVLSLTVSTSASNDGPVEGFWKIGNRDITLTGFAQAAALNISATEIDFGTHRAVNSTASGINLPRYLYLSNNSTVAVPHAAILLPATSAFSVEDLCPSVLLPHSICQMKVSYSSANSPSQDAVRLALDNGLTVLLTGTTLPPTSVTGSSTNPSLNVSVATLTFNTPVIVTGLSSAPQSILVENTGASSFVLSVSVAGDFLLTNGCPTRLAGGTSCTLLVNFAPSQPGTRLGLLNLIAGNGYAPTYVSLNGAATSILPANNGILELGDTLSGEPIVAWYKVQLPVASLTVSSNSSAFGIALVSDVGNGHGTLPASDFASTVTGTCSNCWLGIQFLSQTLGLQAAVLSLSTTVGGNAYALTLTGTSIPVQGLLLTPIAEDFGTLNVNSATAPVTFTLANLLTPAQSVTIQSVSATGDFSVTSNNTGGASCTASLAATASCFIQVVFSPTAVGERTGTLNIMTSAGPVQSTMIGYGSPDIGIAISPSELEFGNVPGSDSTQKSLIISNTGHSTLAIGSITISDPSFTETSGCTTLSPGSLCTVLVGFSPQTATVSATLSIPVTQTINGQDITTITRVALDGGYTTADTGLQILPAEVDFGATTTGMIGGTREFIVNNLSGKQLNVTLHMPRQFPLATNSTCATLSPGGNCTFSVSLLPATDGPVTGSVYVDGVSIDNLTSSAAITYMLGYGAGTGILEVNGLPIPYSPVNFGQVSSGQTSSVTLTLTNGGSSPLTIHRISSAPPFLAVNTCEHTLTNGASCAITITYAPVYEIATGTGSSAARSDSQTLIIESDAASSPDTISLSGLAAPAVSSSPYNPVILAAFDLSQSSLTFSNTNVGSTSTPQTITMTNTGTTTLHIGSIAAPTDFLASTNCATLFVGASCLITVRFAPTNVSTSTARSGSLQIVSDAGTSLEFVSLLGLSSAAPLTFDPTFLNFNSVNVGSTATLSISVTNTTTAPITFLVYSAGGDYSVAGGSCPTIGSTLSSGATCSLSVSFAPSAAGARTGLLTLATDSTTLPLTVALSGTGLQLVAPSPSFVLTANGGSVATLTVATGSPAVYNLLLTPNGFTGPVALTCTPIVMATYASCSLLSSTLTLNGSALPSMATINTITTAAIRSGVGVAVALLGASLFCWRRRHRWIALLLAGTVMSSLFLGCGSSSRAPAASNIQRTPPGTYQYQVTASSTTGTVVSSTVTLNLIVQ